MKRYLWMALLAATLTFAPASIGIYAHAEESYPEVASDAGAETDQQFEQEMDQEEWISDEPDHMEDADSYDPEEEESREPAH